MATPGEAECAVPGRGVESGAFKTLLDDVTDGHARCAPVEADPGSPASLAAIVAARLGFLGAEALEVLRTAASLGPDFAVTDLSAALGRPPELLAPPVQAAIDAEVLEQGGVRLRFRRGLLRQALISGSNSRRFS